MQQLKPCSMESIKNDPVKLGIILDALMAQALWARDEGKLEYFKQVSALHEEIRQHFYKINPE